MAELSAAPQAVRSSPFKIPNRSPSPSFPSWEPKCQKERSWHSPRHGAHLSPPWLLSVIIFEDERFLRCPSRNVAAATTRVFENVLAPLLFGTVCSSKNTPPLGCCQ